MKNLKRALAKLQSHFSGNSIVTVTTASGGFSYSSPTVNKDSQFYIGSVSKHMTAYMLLITLHEVYSKVDIETLLTEKLNILFPNSKLLKQINRAWSSDISLLDLLTHNLD